MSIVVDSLVKSFGSQRALDGISFGVARGEIAGFLGPNGAGKTTTMRVLTGLLHPDSGSISVAGKASAIEIRRLTGYLPEHNPLYLDMYVHEFLRFIAGIYSLKNARKRIDDIIGLCGIAPEQNKRIGDLSKGFRQRVGLAQALLHDPQVLILDEPTSGLDPNQLVEVRKLIKTVSAEKTVLFSSHILQEVEAMCDRVIVINQGKIVADDKLDSLLKNSAWTIVEFDKEVDKNALAQIGDVESIESLGGFRWRLKSVPGRDVRPALMQYAMGNQLIIKELKADNSLELIFGELTHNAT